MLLGMVIKPLSNALVNFGLYVVNYFTSEGQTHPPKAFSNSEATAKLRWSWWWFATTCKQYTQEFEN